MSLGWSGLFGCGRSVGLVGWLGLICDEEAETLAGGEEGGRGMMRGGQVRDGQVAERDRGEEKGGGGGREREVGRREGTREGACVGWLVLRGWRFRAESSPQGEGWWFACSSKMTHSHSLGL